MTVYDDNGMPHPDVGTGAKDFWNRKTNVYCACPPWRYNPRQPKPTNPDCRVHGEEAESQVRWQSKGQTATQR